MAIVQREVVALVIEPDCRYGHGPLALLEDGSGSQKWTIPNALSPSSFSGHLYICKTCGYTEFFDDDIQRTRDDLGLAE